VVIVGGHYGHWELIVPLLANQIHNALIDREVRGICEEEDTCEYSSIGGVIEDM
jgi:hypothetical protein